MKLVIAAAIAAVALPSAANAAITIDVRQEGSSVFVTGSGSFDTTGLTVYSNNQGTAAINAASGIISVGAPAPITISTGLRGPVLGYLQGPKFATTAAGDAFGFSQYLGAVYLPNGYVSNAALSGSSRYDNASLTSLGLSVGQYIYQSAADRITVNISVAAVPEPSSWALMLLGFAGVAAAIRSTRRRALSLA